MPIYASAFFIPTSASIPYILEDVYLRGGYRSVASITERDAIKTAARKQGMLVYVRDEATIYWIPGSAVAGVGAWEKLDVTKFVNFLWQGPLSMTDDFKVSIDEKRIVPIIVDEQAGFALFATADGPVWQKLETLPDTSAAGMGDALMLDAEKNPIWGQIQALPDTAGHDAGSALILDEAGDFYWGPVDGLPSAVGQEDGKVIVLSGGKAAWGTLPDAPPAYGPRRKIVRYQINFVPPRSSLTYTLPIEGTAVVLLHTSVNLPNMLIQLFDKSDFGPLTNPYSFLSSDVKLTDDGTTIDEDGKVTYGRRYSIYSNRDNLSEMYMKVTNTGDEIWTDAEVVFAMVAIELDAPFRNTRF